MENKIILSGYIRYRPKNKTFYLNINSRLLGKHLINLKDKTRVKITREKKYFQIKTNKSGTILRGDRRGPLTSITKNLLTQKEEKELKSEKTKYSLPCKVIIKPKEFELKKYFLYPDQDAAELAYSLEKKGAKIPNRIMTPKAFNYDLEFNLKNKRAIVEITRTKPADKKGEYRNFRHQPQGARIQSQIFGVYRECIKKKSVFGFVIIHKNWKKYKHITELIDECKKINCYPTFVDFNKNWVKESTENILKNVK